MRHLTAEFQSHGGAVDENTTPAITYAWDASPQGSGTYNYDRLVGMTYPARPETGARSLGFSYVSETGDIDSRLNRITAIVRDPLGTPVTEAAYTYMGTSRRVGVTLGNGISQTVIDSGDATGLDRFGRVTDLHFKDGANTVHQYQYGYDISGNRTYARVTQATIGATAHDNDRSYLYGYDDLQRLILAHMGKLSASNQSILNDPAVALRRKLEWFPDSLGNWSGVDEVHNLADKGLTRTDKTPGQDPITTEIRHEVDAFNRIEAVTTDSQPVAHVNDSAGNLVFDGTYVYQYDAWNRLVEVNLAGTLTTADFTSDGKISPVGDPIHVIGDLVVRFQYDALGRLIMAQKVHSGGPPAPVYRTEHYYYDGVRRVQTVDDNATPANTADDLTQHEYVYGPEYVDEFVLQSQRTVVGEQVVQKPFYMLQDGNYNVMALLDENGAVVEQYQWEPYGSLATLDTTASPRPDNAVGHQGLFFCRFDSGDTLSLNALGLYYNRNRWYSPSLGRFTSRDPNCAGSLIIGEIWAHGHPLKLAVDPFDSRGHFEFGLNLYEYLGGNPPVRLDPLGTWFVGFSASLAADLGWTLGSLMAVEMFGGRSPNGWDILRGAAESAAIGTTYGYLLTEVPFVHTPGKNISLMKGAPSSLDATLMGGVGTVLSFMTGMYAGVLDTVIFMVEYNLW